MVIKKIFIIYLTIFTFVPFVYAGKKTTQKQQIKNVKNLAEANTKFALELYRNLADQKALQGKNISFSPFSISAAVAMTYAGAAGKTASEIAKTLHFDSFGTFTHPRFERLFKRLEKKKKKTGYELSIANRLWAQKNFQFLSPFLKLVSLYYNANVKMLDFQAKTEESRAAINRWTEDQTNNKIQELLKKGVIDKRTKLVLTNAVYFKGKWRKPFDKHLTRHDNFYFSNNEKISVPTMRQSGKLYFLAEEGYKVLGMPYGKGNLWMVFVLPNTVGGIKSLENSVNYKTIAGWQKKLKKRKVDVLLPRFRSESYFELQQTLLQMGIKSAFSMGADFSKMRAQKDIYLSKVVHKSFVDVNEEGAEAAAATAAVARRKGKTTGPEPKVFKADHPFIFFIQERKTQSILFLGRVMNPAP